MNCDGEKKVGPKDCTRSRALFEPAAEQGDAKAQFNLGVMYHDGEDGPQDYARARELFELAAAQGYGPPMGYLGVMYLSGVGVKQDLKEAMRWFLRAKTFGFDVTRQVAPVMEQWKLYHADKTRILPGPAPGQGWAAPGAEVEVTGLVNRPERTLVPGLA